jgi:hypothetical protein
MTADILDRIAALGQELAAFKTIVSHGEELAADGTAGERRAGADAGILEGLGKVQPLHGAISGDALALRLQPETAVGLFFA